MWEDTEKILLDREAFLIKNSQNIRDFFFFLSRLVFHFTIIKMISLH